MVTLRSRNKIKECANSPDLKSHVANGDVVSQPESDLKLNREERLKLAMSAMNDGAGMVYTQAVNLFNVKRSTLHDHMSSKCLKFTKGRYPLLSAVEERALLEMLRSLHLRGYTITSYICRRAAFLYAKRCNYSLPRVGRHQMAGRKWFAGFVKRNNVTISSIRKTRKTELKTKSNRGNKH